MSRKQQSNAGFLEEDNISVRAEDLPLINIEDGSSEFGFNKNESMRS